MTNEEQKEKSEFGKGFSYCLGLFLAHAERETPDYDQVSWFYGASDHILEIVVPDCMKHAHLFVDRVIYLSHTTDGYLPTKSDRKWAIQKAKDLLLEWDIKCGIDAVQGEYE